MNKIIVTQKQMDELTLARHTMQSENFDLKFESWAEDIGFSHTFTHAKSGCSFYEDPDGNLWEWDQMIDAFKRDSLTR